MIFVSLSLKETCTEEVWKLPLHTDLSCLRNASCLAVMLIQNFGCTLWHKPTLSRQITTFLRCMIVVANVYHPLKSILWWIVFQRVVKHWLAGVQEANLLSLECPALKKQKKTNMQWFCTQQP